MTRKQYLLAVVLVVLITQVAQAPTLKPSSSSSDCLYFLAILNIVLDHTVKGDPTGELMARYLINAAVPTTLRDSHVKTYEVIINYYEALNKISEDPQKAASLLRSVQSGLDSVSGYAGRLGACSHDIEAAKTLRVYIDMKLKTLREQVYQLIKSGYETQNGGFYTISPLKDTYYPNEVVELVVLRSVEPSTAEMYEWPSLVKIREFRPNEANETHYVFRLELPPATLVESLGLRPRYGYPLVLALYLRLTNNSYVLVGFTRVQYRLPEVQIDSPAVIKRGSPLRVTIISGGSYNASLYFNDLKITNLTLKEGSTVFTIDYQLLNYTIGLNRIKLCVNATTETLTRCFDRPTYIEPLYPRARVIAENVSIAWLGYTTLLISNEDQKDLHVTISNYGGGTVYVPCGESVGIPIYGGFLPVQTMSLEIKIESLEDSYDALHLKLSMYVVNMPVIITLILASVFITTLISRHERSFIPVIAGVWGRVQRAPHRTESLLRSAILKPYELGLNSRVALLYYGLLRKLKLRLPLLTETLREHYLSITHRMPERLKKVLWRFLLLVERDLYSSRKPPYQEAENTYRGVLSVAGEE